MLRISIARSATLAGLLVLSTVPLAAQEPITNRLPPMPLRGVIVEVSCFRQQGAATVSSPEQINCAKAAVAKGGTLGILSEGDGLFKIVGTLADNKYARLAPHIGQRVDVTGAEVIISNNYDYRSYEAQKIAPAKK